MYYPTTSEQKSARQEKVIKTLKRLIWAYFWLLIFEGALRKWIVPPLSTPLLIVRDPIVLIAYFQALEHDLFPKDRFTKSIIAMAFLFLFVHLGVLIMEGNNLLNVIIFGMRTNFLHLPFIFLIAKIFDLEDVKKVGKWVLILSLPMALLMVLQFNVSPEHFLNRGAGGDGVGQITANFGKIRPPALFSFSNGVTFFYALATAFFLFGLVTVNAYPNSLMVCSGIGILTGAMVSVNRGLVLSIALVVIGWLYGIWRQGKLFGATTRLIGFAGFLAMVLSLTDFFRKGLEVTTYRFEQGGTGRTIIQRIFDRVISTMTSPFQDLDNVPLFGYGIGIGTNAGSKLIFGRVYFLVSEAEWGRIIYESGPILGSSFLLWRCLLVIWLGLFSLRQLAKDNILPTLIFSATAYNLLLGQFGQPTAQGFAALSAGLTLAACRLPGEKLSWL
ncbi:hypothetical protein Pse7367_1864 [Thalassoporum mexicanum PCC 7367]|uniref:hypothetical protein n=1 Tax=Thalassoporum mexicanum TaxID=3457544 RepID=UPI00029FAD9B|nr:hypothetical protein [Pseudanabaena sp. PCC 7367]AFY70140.1 hypothetical protein Pse7367_1864 [Pseudanabaena sp. PCC 7367]